MPARRLTNDDHERIAELREAGMSCAAIGREIGCSSSTIYWQCLRLGAEPPKPQRSWDGIRGPAVLTRNGHTVRRYTPEEDARLLAMEAAGVNDRQIGKALGRRHNSVRGRLMTLARREARMEAGA